MGSALSCIFHASSVSGGAQQPARSAAPPARVIAADGSLKEVPISDPPLASASDVLGSADAASASSSFFVCNSDALYFGEPPPALGAAERLRPGQMYFVLPAAMLGRALSSADMAALAARAIAALPPEKPRRRRGRGRVVPVLSREDGKDGEEAGVFHEALNEQTLGGFAAVTSRARSGDRVVAVAATRQTRPSALKRALSMIREEAE
ncbi:hypothetical protein PAHAL_1G069800 [Panicum hallii]|jgi:hypothetical protein|uniref:Uncharacterized protein n=1 Tax=Panicum hallii TaxID=206008 RepID=A0A2S3GMG1_9POAL|nr:uncharacterized protein LOC112878267 [Panicum hallii]PAN04471.1 hypothetical protein PAHAL_1G069800 [Panicum hallii]